MLYTLELLLKFADPGSIFVELVYFLLMLYIFLDRECKTSLWSRELK